MAWTDPATGVVHLPVVGVADQKLTDLKLASSKFGVEIDSGDWSIRQLEHARDVLLERLHSAVGDKVLGSGLSSDRGRSRLVVRVTREAERTAQAVVTDLRADALGGVDPAVIRLEAGEIDVAEPGPSSANS